MTIANAPGGEHMTNAEDTFSPDWRSPPGDSLGDLLGERGMTQTELAERLGVSLKHVNRTIKGAAPISPELALGLEKVFGAPARFWMTREAHYQAAQARREELEVLEQSADWARSFPVKELRRRGLIGRDNTGAELVRELLNFFGIARPGQWKDPIAVFRKSAKVESDPFALAAWLREGEILARDVSCEPYDQSRFLDMLQEVRGLTRLEPNGWWPELQEQCASAGIAVVIVPSYPGERANGATRWLGPDKALIQLSLRYRWEDIFWFSFFHEAGHVVLHRKKDVFIEVAPRDRAGGVAERQREEEADRFASRTLIPDVNEHRLSTLTLAEIEGFARRLGIAPAIVLGRLQHDGRIPYSHGNDMRRRFVLDE